ncbi:MAG TPA: hypothetical protein VM166_01755 [Gemmatimonadaceae bacterium]|nr:hypothetical protein [Gemmatimonadaceae bacterium]
MSVAIQRHAIELLWKQWTAAGVASNAAPPQQAIDVEAMIAFTPFVAAADPRLGDESRDWCARVGKSFISISRLRQIARSMPSRPQGGALDLPAAVVSKLPIQGGLSNKSRAPSLELPCLVQLRSRYVFGIGARADVMSHLAMRDRTAGPQSAAAINPGGYTKQAIASVLDELSQAGVLKKLTRARSVRYELSKEGPLRSLLAPLPPRMPQWAERFAIVATILEKWRQFGKRATYAVELAKALDQIRSTIAQAGELAPISGKPSQVLGRVERWAISLLDDNVWEESWMFDGQDIIHEILQTLDKPLVEASTETVGYTELDRLSFRNADRRRGTAEFVVQFTAEHPKGDSSRGGRIAGKLRFDPESDDKETFLDSLEVTDVSVHHDVDDHDY